MMGFSVIFIWSYLNSEYINDRMDGVYIHAYMCIYIFSSDSCFAFAISLSLCSSLSTGSLYTTGFDI